MCVYIPVQINTRKIIVKIFEKKSYSIRSLYDEIYFFSSGSFPPDGNELILPTETSDAFIFRDLMAAFN